MSKASCPLLITRFSLSERSAIGTQTGHIVRQLNSFHHIFWSQYEFINKYEASSRIENIFLSPFSIFKKDNFLSRLTSRMGLSWWHNDRLKPRYISVLNDLKSKVTIIYLAPIDSQDSRRMNSIVAEFPGIPIVIHLWDCLDDNINNDPITQSLIRRARRVFCLNDMIGKKVQSIGGNAEIIPFRRLPSKSIASFSPKVKRSIALIGDIVSYQEGFFMLLDALKQLKNRNLVFEIIYIGPISTLQQISHSSSIVKATGFVSSEERDRLVSQCDIGFLPGPTKSPANDARSRYSVPSRLLDFLVAGLPIVGTLHPASAAMQMCRSVDLEIGMDCQSPDELANRIMTLLEPKVWTTSSELSLRASQVFTVQHDHLIQELCEAEEQPHQIQSIEKRRA